MTVAGENNIAASTGGGVGVAPHRQQGGGEETNDAPPVRSSLMNFVESVLRMFLIFTCLQLFMKWGERAAFETKPPPPPPQPATAAQQRSDLPSVEGVHEKKVMESRDDVSSLPGNKFKPTCIWKKGTQMALSVYITESSQVHRDESSKGNNNNNKSFPILAEWHEKNLILGGKSESADVGSGWIIGGDHGADVNERNATLTIPIGQRLWNNESHLYAHVELHRVETENGKESEDGGTAMMIHKKSNKKEKGEDDKVKVMRKVIPLTRHRLRKKLRNERNLLETASAKSLNDTVRTPSKNVTPSDSTSLTLASLNTTHDQILLYLKPSLTLQFVELTMALPERKKIPPQFGVHMDWVDDAHYYPVLYSSEFWITKDALREINGTVTEAKVDVRVEDVKMWKWQLMSGMEQSWRSQEQFYGEDESSSDVFRTMLLETNPYLLAITALVSVLHSIFDFLAFKNDITFFRGTKSMEGLSIRSMLVNAWFQLVILLYLADNETNFMVLMSNGIGLAIEVWKISKAVTVSFRDGKIQWEEVSSYKKSKTKEYDEIATRHLLFVTMPLVTGYGLYSLTHQSHKGWYSWILSTLVGFIYMFGFVMMTPQLFINYKLQSVAHLNWRTMSYKSINTFIDDLFAFVIKMPIMHRLACLRDDVVFFIFLYQRYIYRTDYSRVNEYGQCSQLTAEMAKEKEEESHGRSTESAVTKHTVENAGETGVRQRRGAREKKVKPSG